MLLPFQVGCSKSASKFDSLFAYFEPENHWNTTNVVYVIWAVFEHFKKRYQKANTISLIYNTLSVFLLNIWVSFLKPILNTLPFRASLHFIMWTQGVASLALGYVLHWAFSPPLLNPKLELIMLHLRCCMNRLCLWHIASLWQFDGIKVSDFEDVRAPSTLWLLSSSASERM